MYEKTLILFKPDAVERHLVGDIMSCFEEGGIRIHGLKMLKADRQILELHYHEHKEKPFFESVVEFLMSGPIVALVAGGFETIEKVRKICGNTKPANADVESIRGHWGHLPSQSTDVETMRNLVHASDSKASAALEIAIWFEEGELFE